ncbi:MAG: hypothetical protein N2Z60_06990 [Elusimicrobiales bacterium]|nr:hypothetical protein [Elusimicrobiales bacterium]
MKKILLFLAVINLNFLYSQNLEDKISQMLWPAFDTDQTEKIKKAANENIGGIQIMWGEYSDEKTRGIIQELYEITKDSYPPFIAIDYEGGSVYIHQTHNILNLPSNMAIGKSEDYKNIPILFYLLGLELKKLGINTVFSPTADVNTEKYNPIINVRAFSDDKNIVTKISEMVIDGFTSAGIIPTLKHFPGHGMTRSDSHLTLPVTDIDPIELYQTHIYPFKSIIEKKKADIIMVSHVLYKNIDKDMPASLSRIIITNILRDQLKYEGVVITDSLDMKAVTSKYSIEKAAVLAIKNGADMVLIGKYPVNKVRDEILKALKNREISEQRIEESYKRIISLKEKYKKNGFRIENGLFDMAYKKIANEISFKSIKVIKGNLENIKKSKIAFLLFLPQRFSTEATIIYEEMAKNGFDIKITVSNSDKINANNFFEENKTDLIIIGNYSWPNMNEKKLKTIKELSKKYNRKIFINFLNPIDSEFLYDDFDTIIETYGINEFSAYALAKILNNEKLTE